MNVNYTRQFEKDYLKKQLEAELYALAYPRDGRVYPRNVSDNWCRYAGFLRHHKIPEDDSDIVIVVA